MKKSLFLCVLALLGLSAVKCCKTAPNSFDPIDLLPPATQTGENTFGCLVNGEAFVVTNTNRLVAIYQGGGLQFGARENINEVEYNLYVILNDPIEVNNDYSIADFPTGYSSCIVTDGDNICYYDFEDTFYGKVNFSQIDKVNYIISGTFEFATVIDGCDTVRIADGRFDMQYIP